MDTIVIVNRSSVADAVIRNIIPALQDQVTQDFEPVWRIGAKIEFTSKAEFVGNDGTLSPGAWPLEIFDHTDVEGAGGYHVDESGRVSGKAFWLDAVEAGEAPTVDISHEMLEMLADPTTAIMIALQGRYAGLQCLREVCDAVEADALGYTRPGADGSPVLLSDFVDPTYFYIGEGKRFVYDFKGHLTAPAPALQAGGYLGIYDPATGQWSQISDFDRTTARRSRRSMRHGRTAWRIAHS